MKSRLFISLTAVLVIFFAVEAFLRFTVDRACFSGTGSAASICREDPVLGWRNKTGDFTFQNGEEKTVHIKLLNSGRRAVAANGTGHADDREKIILIGGSFMFGQGLSDEETMAWKLQDKMPEMKVLNYGVQAYGTYQSLLMLEHILPETSRPSVVIYGFMGHHLERNTAPQYWRAIMNRCSGPAVYMPYVSLDEKKNLVRHAPVTFDPGPFIRHLETLKLIYLFYELKFDKPRNTHGIMQRLLLEMRDRCRTYNCQFIVAFLNAPPDIETVYTRFCRNNEINAIHYDLRGFQQEDLQIDDGHPNAILNTLWADQTFTALSTMLNPQP
ncbi:MAG: hypothetical protein SWH61_00070 [Thermodesulfobacteriota bacterium]|nr:hypothetical protein [Thermodesulfobacteriota bacterium]